MKKIFPVIFLFFVIFSTSCYKCLGDNENREEKSSYLYVTELYRLGAEIRVDSLKRYWGLSINKMSNCYLTALFHNIIKNNTNNLIKYAITRCLHYYYVTRLILSELKLLHNIFSYKVFRY